MKKNKTECIFCGSTSYGYGCPYSPHKRHVHPAYGSHCIYCGSVSTGYGCPYNPISKMHIKGMEYNNMVKESLRDVFILAILNERIFKPITDTKAYEVGLIDGDGNILREKREDEAGLLTYLDYFFIKIRRMIGEEKINLLKQNFLLENVTDYDPNNVHLESYFKQKISRMIGAFRDIFIEASEFGLSRECIEKLMISEFVGEDDRKKIQKKC